MSKRIMFAMIMLSVHPYSALGYNDDTVLGTASDMSAWCKDNSFAYLAANADNVSYWSHSIVTKGNAYVMKARWRVDGEWVYTECKSRVGGQSRYATIRLIEDD